MNKLLVLDFETYYDKDFTLKKFNYIEYVNDPRFHVILVSVMEVDPKGVEPPNISWFSGGKEETRQWLSKFDWANSALLCHNTAFDATILSSYFSLRPKEYMDTLSMATPIHSHKTGVSLASLAQYYGIGTKGTEVLDAKGKRRDQFSPSELNAYAEYCMLDVQLTYGIFLELLRQTPKIELAVISETVRMTVEPKLIYDVKMLEDEIEYTDTKKQQILDACGVSKEDLMSNDKFAIVLRSIGIEPKTKISLKTQKEAYAFAKTDPEMVELLEHPDEVVALIAAARVETKSTMRGGRLSRMLTAARLGPIPFPLKYAGAHTNRFAGDWKWNMQNLPKHTAGRRSVLKDALKAPPGFKVISIDSSQVEVRVLAWLAGEKSLLSLFSTNGDPYCDFGSVVYNRTITKADEIERFIGKGCVLGLGFKMGAVKLKASLAKPVNGVFADIPLEQAQYLVDTYRRKYRAIHQFWAQCKAAIANMHDGLPYVFGTGASIKVEHNALLLPSGNRLRYRGLDKYIEEGTGYLTYTYEDREKRHIKRIYDGLLCENIVQSVARDIICWQMVKAGKAGYHAVGTVHDELIFVVPDAQVKEAMAVLTGIMKSVPKWAEGCPISCEGAFGNSYGEA